MSLFIVMTNIIRSYTFTKQSGQKLVTMVKVPLAIKKTKNRKTKRIRIKMVVFSH